MAPLKLSILMPVYNERTVVERCIAQVLSAPLPEEMERELIIVDDCSTDDTWILLQRLLKIFDKTVWIWRRIDPLLPWRGLSLILVARK